MNYYCSNVMMYCTAVPATGEISDTLEKMR